MSTNMQTSSHEDILTQVGLVKLQQQLVSSPVTQQLQPERFPAAPGDDPPFMSVVRTV